MCKLNEIKNQLTFGWKIDYVDRRSQSWACPEADPWWTETVGGETNEKGDEISWMCCARQSFGGQVSTNEQIKPSVDSKEKKKKLKSQLDEKRVRRHLKHIERDDTRSLYSSRKLHKERNQKSEIGSFPPINGQSVPANSIAKIRTKSKWDCRPFVCPIQVNAPLLSRKVAVRFVDVCFSLPLF